MMCCEYVLSLLYLLEDILRNSVQRHIHWELAAWAEFVLIRVIGLGEYHMNSF